MFAVVLFVCGTADRWGDAPLIAGVRVVGLQSVSTYGRGVSRAVRAGHTVDRVVVFWVASATVVVVSGVAAYGLRGEFAPLVPPPSEMLVALWTGLFASTAAVAAMRTVQVEAEQTYELNRRSRLEIPELLLNHARRESARLAADYHLVRSVILVETSSGRPGRGRSSG